MFMTSRYITIKICKTFNVQRHQNKRHQAKCMLILMLNLLLTNQITEILVYAQENSRNNAEPGAYTDVDNALTKWFRVAKEHSFTA